MTPSPTGTMRVVFRAYGGGNSKPRPSFFSKRLSALSVLRAAQHCDDRPYLLLVVDGSEPDDFAGIAEQFDEIVPINAGSTKKSYIAAIDVALGQGWADDDLVFLCEDDYLLLPEALRDLQRADARLGGDRYLCGYEPDNSAYFGAVKTQRTLSVPDSIVATVDGVSWKQIVSTTSTFAARVAVLRTDRLHHVVGAYSGSAFDHTIAMTVAGRRPYRWRHLFSDLKSRKLSKQQLLFIAARPPMRLLNNVLAARRSSAHELFCSTRPLMTHMELDFVADGVDWPAEAGRVREWEITA